jgi:hypothetical protein
MLLKVAEDRVDVPSGPNPDPEGETMAYRYTLSTPDGDLFAEASYAHPPNVGDVIHVNSGQRMRVTRSSRSN